jgi:hypothetical protein
MGLFTQRPEENDEWAGLPSEPLRPTTAAEQLPDAAPVDVGALDALFGAGSVAIPLVAAPSPEPPDADDPPD